MLDVVVSNSQDVLADRVAAALQAYRAAHGPLAPVDVVVPHRALEAWLAAEVAKRLGIAVALRVRRPGAFVRDFATLVGERRLDAAALRGPVLDFLLSAPELNDDEFGQVRAFLEASSGGAGASGRLRTVRAFVLSGRIARIFAEYGLESPELLEAWSRGEGGTGATERWQRAIWRNLLANFVETGPRPELPKRVLVVDPGGASALFERVLRRLSASGSQVSAFIRHPGGGPDGSFGSPVGPTSSFGEWLRGSRRRTSAIISAAEMLETSWEAETGTGALGRFRGEWLREDRAPLPDASDVSFVRAPRVRRECEEIAAAIWSRIGREGAGEKLRFHQIAVMIPRALRDEYVTHLSSVFEESHRIPHVIWEAPLSRSSRVARLARDLLALPVGDLRRADVLAVLQHPLVAGAFSTALPEEWPAWIDSVGVFHGLDEAEHEGTYLAHTNAVHWDQGLRRLALGAFLAGHRSGVDELFEAGGAAFRAEERTQSAHAAMGRMLRLVRSLLADARFARTAEMTASGWSAFLAEFIAAYVRPAGESDERELGAVFRALRGLSELGTGDRLLPYEVALAFAREVLDEPSGRAAGHLAQGVVVGTPESLRGVPFRVVFFAGLEAGSYPARAFRNELDARDPDPDRETTRARDCAAFVDAVLSAREELIISWVGVDPLSGDAREPSLLVAELQSWLRRRGIDVEARTRTLNVERADQAADDPAFSRAFPDAHREAAATLLGAEVRRAAGVVTAPATFARQHPGAAELAELLRVPDLPPRARTPLQRTQVSLTQIRRFLECPIQGYASAVLRMRSAEEDRGDLDEEPFDTDALIESVVLGETLSGVFTTWTTAALHAPGQRRKVVGDALDGLRLRLQAAGRLPVGLFGRIFEERTLALLDEYASAVVAEVGAQVHATAEIRRFGRADGLASGAAQPPVLVTVPDVSGASTVVEIVGRTQLLFGNPLESWCFVRTLPPADDSSWGEAKRMRYFLRCWLDHIVLAASGEPPVRRRVHLLGRLGDTVGIDHRGLALVGPDEAREWLALVVGALLANPPESRAPAVAVMQFWRMARGGSGALRDAFVGPPGPPSLDAFRRQIDAAYVGFTPRERTDNSPVRNIADFPLPSMPEAQQLAARFDPFLSRIIAEDNADAAEPQATATPRRNSRTKG